MAHPQERRGLGEYFGNNIRLLKSNGLSDLGWPSLCRWRMEHPSLMPCVRTLWQRDTGILLMSHQDISNPAWSEISIDYSRAQCNQYAIWYRKPGLEMRHADPIVPA